MISFHKLSAFCAFNKFTVHLVVYFEEKNVGQNKQKIANEMNTIFSAEICFMHINIWIPHRDNKKTYS